MVRMYLNMLDEQQRKTLLKLARDSIRCGLDHGHALEPELSQYPESFAQHRATFVTLKKGGQLRGCIGTLEAYQSLLRDVCAHAYDAAFNDPRFSILRAPELAEISIHISILSPQQPIVYSTQEDLMRQVEVGVDGLVLNYQQHRATFLPAVWRSLPDKEYFMKQLKLKAGLSENFWSDSIKIYRYHSEEFGEEE